MVGGFNMVRSAVWDVHDLGVQDEESQGARRDVMGTKECQQNPLSHIIFHGGFLKSFRNSSLDSLHRKAVQMVTALSITYP